MTSNKTLLKGTKSHMTWEDAVKIKKLERERIIELIKKEFDIWGYDEEIDYEPRVFRNRIIKRLQNAEQ